MKIGGLRWVATVSLPDICARLARIAPRTNAPCGSVVYHINELVRVVKDWQQETALEYASSSHPWMALDWSGKVQRDLKEKGERVYCGSTTFGARSDASYWDRSTEGRRQLGYVIGLMSTTLKDPSRILQWASKFARKMVRSCAGREVFALSEVGDRMLILCYSRV